MREAPEWVVLRYGLLYGAGTWYAPDGLRAEQARAGKLTADADISSFVHVDDAATAAVAALEWPSGAVNVCDDDPAPGWEWVPASAPPSVPIRRRPRPASAPRGRAARRTGMRARTSAGCRGTRPGAADS